MDIPKRIAFFPDWSESNSYQKKLYLNLSAYGHICRGFKSSEFTALWLILNMFKYDIIHIHWLNSLYIDRARKINVFTVGAFFSKLIFARTFGYKVVWTVHNYVSHETKNYRLELISRKIAAKLVNLLIVHCNYAKEKIIGAWRLSQHKIAVIPHGSYVGCYADNVNRCEARLKLGVPEDSFVFLFFGMIRSYKGLKTLINNFTKLKERMRGITLIIAGCPFNNDIKCEIEEMAHCSGILLYLQFIPDNDVQYYFKASDVVVLPYQNILTSGVALLALSFGKPVIAPSKGCLPELLNNQIAFLYNNENELPILMEKAVLSSEIEAMGKKAMLQAETLSWCKIVDNYYIPLLKRFI